MAGQDEWEDRVKRLKLGVGNKGTLATKGACNKGGRFVVFRVGGKRGIGGMVEGGRVVTPRF